MNKILNVLVFFVTTYFKPNQPQAAKANEVGKQLVSEKVVVALKEVKVDVTVTNVVV